MNPNLNPVFKKQLSRISPECWEMYDSNQKLWNEIFRLGIQAERNRIKLRSGTLHWLDAATR